MPNPHNVADAKIPYQIAVLCYLYDEQGRVLLLRRAKAPNRGMYSPIGGKLELDLGESPHDCAKREIFEEAGLDLPHSDLRLVGIVSECAYEGQTHWLIFLFEVARPIDAVEIPLMEIDEGRMEWVPADKVSRLKIPHTDETVMWPLTREHRGGFFMVHIDCSVDPMQWTVHESVKAGHTDGEATP